MTLTELTRWCLGGSLLILGCAKAYGAGKRNEGNGLLGLGIVIVGALLCRGA